MTESRDRSENATYNEESEGNAIPGGVSTSKSRAQTTGTLRIRSLAEPLIVHGEGVRHIKVPVNLAREARRRRNLIINKWLDDSNTSTER
jgi:hypothetical protein